ncbi:MAG: 50S ribosomal protein L18 [Candidatus Aenigmarchaeota archaeon]|nr:50S ribosomal protein L18 [Candidatus Aenigmarchaeota archaeon]
MFQMKFRRRAEQKTNYRKRLLMLLGRKNRIVVRRSSNGFSIQLVKYAEKGDQTFVEITSKHLREHGWKGHTGSMPAAYLTGMLFGKTAAKEGFDSGIADLGLQSKKSQSLFAAALGVRDAGIDIPVDAEIPGERLKGKHIADYAQHLKSTDQEKYRKQFSACLKSGLQPENITQHFEEVKKRIGEL